MKRKLYIPIWNTNTSEENLASYLADFEAVGADTVFLALDRNLHFSEDRREDMALLRRNIAFFRERGYQVGVWFSGFGYGNPPTKAYREKTKDYTKILSVTGKVSPGDALCPTDPRFMRDFLSLIADVAATKPDLIMIDDDMCLSVRPGLGCFCPAHIAKLENALGESLAGRELAPLFFSGKPNRHRSAWISVMSDTMREVCRMARSTVDSISSEIRLGFASGYTSWDIEGADAIELTRILAGKTKPFLRLTGAPYWSARAVMRFGGQQLAESIELARMQEAWCEGAGIEIFSEGDSYPRPRYHVPSSYLECFDLATAASGNMGALKYFIDYRSKAGYETGYVKHHMQNLPLYDAIANTFDQKEAVGVRVYEVMRKIEGATLPDSFAGEKQIMAGVFSPGGTMLVHSSIPTKYKGDGETWLAFGENAARLETLPKKLITDLSGAEALLTRGVDLGIASIEPAPIPSAEHFDDEVIEVFNAHGRFARLALKRGAVLESEFSLEDDRFPASYRYHNGETEFMVLAFDGYRTAENSALFLSYLRAESLRRFAGYYPHIKNSPCLYTLMKQNEAETAILFLNIFEDPIIDGVIELSQNYRHARLVGGEGELAGDKIKLSSVIPPYGGLIVILS